MNKSRVKTHSLQSQSGRPLHYQQYSIKGNKRHYWDTPNKNFGFYTSEQMEDLSRRIKTDPQYRSVQPYRVHKEGRFIVNAYNPEDVHCCTCHNNPQRYFKNAQRCKFCEMHKKQQESKSFNYRSEGKNTDTVSPLSAGGVEKMIQVSLPRVELHRHSSKHYEHCPACQAKNKQRQGLASPKSSIFQESPKRILLRHLQGSYRNNSRKGRKLKSQLQN